MTQQQIEAKEERKGRVLMPQTAEIVDELRAAYGVQAVDAAIFAGQQARREFERRMETDGELSARRWLAVQRFPVGCFWASEAGREVGIRRP